jgi:hypothetical protein
MAQNLDGAATQLVQRSQQKMADHRRFNLVRYYTYRRSDRGLCRIGVRTMTNLQTFLISLFFIAVLVVVLVKLLG